MKSDRLTVSFDNSLYDESGLCVSREVNGKVTVLKMELGEQADILYHLLTEQTAKAEIRTETSEDDLDNLDSMLEDLWNATESEDKG